MEQKRLLYIWFIIVVTVSVVLAGMVYYVDPFFHFHKPHTDKFYYYLNNQRTQNDGITKHFDYDAIITGTSMMENFKTTEMDELFGTDSVKLPYPGGTFKEINDNLKIAVKCNPDLRIVIRGLDMSMLIQSPDAMRFELGVYPFYLYDNNPFNDVKYIFNKNVLFDRIYQMFLETEYGDFSPGITSFDEYERSHDHVYGREAVLPDGLDYMTMGEPVYMSDSEKTMLERNITQNVVTLAKYNPEVEFYYFFPPYSIIFWRENAEKGTVYRQIEAEKRAIELMLECDNIHICSFNDRTEIITDLDNYEDTNHYGEWINSYMLKSMHDGDCFITRDNYEDYINDELDYYLTYDYNSLVY